MSEPVGTSTSDRLLNAVRKLIRGEFPNYDFYPLYEYAIQGVDPSTGEINCTPTDTTVRVPPLSGLTLRPSLVGENVVATVGSLCLVEFINADPTRPQIVSVGPTIFNGTIDAVQTVNIGPSASSVDLGIAAASVSRVFDAAVIYFDVATPLAITGAVTNILPIATTTPGTFTGTITLASSGAPGTPVPCPGMVSSGSAKTFA